MKVIKNFSFRKLLYNKKIAILLSVLAAFLFWLIIVIDQNPEREQTFSNLPIDISTEGTVWGDQGLEVVNEIAQKASVTVFGPNYIVSSLKSDDFRISADLSAVNGAGNYIINLTAVRNSEKSGYSFINVSPSTITVQFDYFDQKEFTITPKVEGYQRVDGFVYDDAVVANTEEQMVSVKGPRSVVSKISSVIAYAFTNKEFDTTTTFDSSLKFIDSDGKEIDSRNLDLSLESVKVSVPVSKTKTLKFIPSYINIPNTAVVETLNKCFTADINAFTIAGAPELIDSINNIEFTPVDITKITSKNAKNIFEVKPLLPNGIRIIDGFETVSVSYNMSAFTVKKVKITHFDDEDTLESGLVADYSNEIYVEVCGKSSVLNSLSTKDYFLSVDLSNTTKGEALVKATVKNTMNSAVWQTSDCEIKVVIK